MQGILKLLSGPLFRYAASLSKTLVLLFLMDHQLSQRKIKFFFLSFGRLNLDDFGLQHC